MPNSSSPYLSPFCLFVQLYFFFCSFLYFLWLGYRHKISLFAGLVSQIFYSKCRLTKKKNGAVDILCCKWKQHSQIALNVCGLANAPHIRNHIAKQSFKMFLSLFFFNFVLLNFSGIRTGMFWVQREHTDHLTTSMVILYERKFLSLNKTTWMFLRFFKNEPSSASFYSSSVVSNNKSILQQIPKCEKLTV